MSRCKRISMDAAAVVLLSGPLAVALVFSILPTRAEAVAGFGCSSGSCTAHCMSCTSGCGAAGNNVACCQEGTATFCRCMYLLGGNCNNTGMLECDNCKGYAGTGGCIAPSCATGTLTCLRKMRENSALYQRFETQCTRDLVASKPIPGFELSHQMRHQIRQYRLVVEGAKYYFRADDKVEMQDGSSRESHSEQAYDGELTRMNYQGQLGNIDDRRISPRVLPPHRLGMPEWGEHDVAEVLEMSEKIRAESRFAKLTRMENRVLRDVEWNGLKCIEAESLAYSQSEDKPAMRYVLTIAPERNYLVVRTLRYYLQLSETSPEGEYETDDWRQLAPGIWCPFRCVERIYRRAEEDELEPKEREKGERSRMVPESVITHTVQSANLAPSHDAGLFRDIVMPSGTEVHILKGGKIVETQIDGVRLEAARAPEPEAPARLHPAVLWLAAGNAMLIALFLVYRKWRRARMKRAA